MAKKHVIEVGDWQERRGRDRVLVENPDQAQLWAYAEVLHDAGYDVATCTGEHPDGHDRCPLIESGRCGLVQGADVVVSTCSMHRGDTLLAVIGAQGSTPIVFEAPQPDFERYDHLAESATLIPMPVTTQALLAAVEEARARSEQQGDAAARILQAIDEELPADVDDGPAPAA
jgi:DNA-binding NtrC family response regulator